LDEREFNRLLKLSDQSKSALEKLYSFYFTKIVYYLGRTYGKTLAEDVAQEFFLTLKDVADKQEYISSPTTWVYRCCENIAKRKISYESRYMSLTNEIVDNDKFSKELIYGDLYDEINKLNKLDQDIIELFYWEGFNLREIAEKLQVKPALVRKRHVRIIKKLKKIFLSVTK